MEYSLLITESFKQDVMETIGYLADNLGSPSAACRLFDAIDDAIGLIRCMPEMHAISTKPRLCDCGIRECLVRNYVIAYRVDGANVIVLRLFHQTQDYEQPV